MVSEIKGRKVVGLKQTKKFLSNSQGKCLYIAKNVEKELIQPIIELTKDKDLDIIYIDNMKELGTLCGIDVEATVALKLTE